MCEEERNKASPWSRNTDRRPGVLFFIDFLHRFPALTRESRAGDEGDTELIYAFSESGTSSGTPRF